MAPEPEDPTPVLGLFGAIPPGRLWILLVALAFFPPSLAAIGAAIAYELMGVLWSTAVGVVYGAGLGILLARDFLNWKLRWVTIGVTLVYAGLFAVAYV